MSFFPISNATNTSVTVGSSSTEVLPSKGDRYFAVLVNDSDEAIYLGLGADAELNKGVRLNANGGSVIFEGEQVFTGSINAICASGSKNLTVSYA